MPGVHLGRWRLRQLHRERGLELYPGHQLLLWRYLRDAGSRVRCGLRDGAVQQRNLGLQRNGGGMWAHDAGV